MHLALLLDERIPFILYVTIRELLQSWINTCRQYKQQLRVRSWVACRVTQITPANVKLMIKTHLWTVSIILTRLKMSLWKVFLMRVNQNQKMNLIQLPTWCVGIYKFSLMNVLLSFHIFILYLISLFSYVFLQAYSSYDFGYDLQFLNIILHFL